MNLDNSTNSTLRQDLMAIICKGLEAANPYQALKRSLKINGSVVSGNTFSVDLDSYERVFILGAGKATYGLAKAIEETLRDRIDSGLVVLKDGFKGELNSIKILHASHPVPSSKSFRAGSGMLLFADSVGSKDLVFSLITGGSSSLLSLPQTGIPYIDKIKVHQLLLASGASIAEINAVRKHLSKIKGGKLGKVLNPGKIINLTVSDVVGDVLDLITDPTVPDTSTFDDVERVLNNYDLWKKLPDSIVHYLSQKNVREETPKSYDFPHTTEIIVRSNAACLGAARHAHILGYRPYIISEALEGNVDYAVSVFLNAINQHSNENDRIALIAGGETVVALGEEATGQGGPNQHFSLTMALNIHGKKNIAVAAVDTDGTDGPTNYAGGIVDSLSLTRCHNVGIDIQSSLSHFDSLPVLVKTGDAIFTGHTGTNVNDLKIALIDKGY